jgi:transposase
VTTLAAVLRLVERKYGKARRVWVFDRGIVSEENLAALRKRGARYLVGTVRKKLKEFEREMLEGGWEQVRPEVEVKLVSIPAGEETYVLCRTASRKEKEKAIRSRFSTRMETALNKLKKRVAEKRLKDRNKIERQIGRIQARHPQVADLYQMEVKQSAEGGFNSNGRS